MPSMAQAYTSSAIVASPAAAAETIVCSVAGVELPSDTALVVVFGYAAFTVGTNGTACRLRVRRGDVTGTVVADTGALTGGVAAAALVEFENQGSEAPGALAQATYVLTLTVTAGSAASTVSNTNLTVLTFR